MTHTVRLKAYFATFDTVHSFSCFLCIFIVYDAHLCQRSKGHGQTTLPCNNSESILSYQAEDSVWILLISKIVQLMNTMQVSYQELRIRSMATATGSGNSERTGSGYFSNIFHVLIPSGLVGQGQIWLGKFRHRQKRPRIRQDPDPQLWSDYRLYLMRFSNAVPVLAFLMQDLLPVC